MVQNAQDQKMGHQKRGKENDTKWTRLKNILKTSSVPATRKTKTSQCECLAQSQCEKFSQCELPTSVWKHLLSVNEPSQYWILLYVIFWRQYDNMSLLGSRVVPKNAKNAAITDWANAASRILRSKPAGRGGSCRAFLKLPASRFSSDFQKWLNGSPCCLGKQTRVCLKLAQLNAFPRI